MIAVISDIHANLEALLAVLDDARLQGAVAVYCLGDVVGYGPNPVECLHRAMRWEAVLLGNHDHALMNPPDGFGVCAEQAVLWHRAAVCQSAKAGQLWDFLAERPRSMRQGNRLFVHGSARDPLNEYVFPEDVYHERKLGRIATAMGDARNCFQGHTHHPGVFEQACDGWTFRTPEELGEVYRLGDRTAMINVGAVGQPRDGDWRACYALLDGDTVSFRRVEYDVDATVRKIYDQPELCDFSGDRLREGR